MKPLRILLVDDSPEFLDAMTNFLGHQPQMEVVGRARSGSEAIQLAQELAPDLVLMDVEMKPMNGLEATRLIKELPAKPRVIVLTFHGQREYPASALAAGADGFVYKFECVESLMPAIRKLFPQLSE